MAYTDAKVGTLVDQNDSAISAFKARGGKLLVYNGWHDPVVNPIDTSAYYDTVKALRGSQGETDKFFSLFMVPGMGHCAGGTGTTTFGNHGSPSPIVDAQHDVLMAMDNRVDKGVARNSNIASKVVVRPPVLGFFALILRKQFLKEAALATAPKILSANNAGRGKYSLSTGFEEAKTLLAHLRRMRFFLDAAGVAKNPFVHVLISCFVFLAASRLTAAVAVALAVPATLLA